MKQTITFLFFTVFTLVLSAQTVTIQGGSSYGTIQEAIDASIDGDVILITGVHTEPISFGKSITLRGTDPTTDIIQAAASASNDGTGERVINITEGDFTITIENLGIRYGNINKTGEPAPAPSSNGAGIYADKVIGLLTLNNLIIEQNYTATNGGALSLAGTNANIINCTIRNNTSKLDGGAIIAAPNNVSGVSNIVNIKQSLIDSNTGRNGGGIYINGNKDYGNDYLIAINIENSTISNNTADNPSASTALAGGGAICSNSQAWTSNTSIGNVTLSLIHATLYGNVCPATPARAGIQCNNAKVTNFSAYNSIIVSVDDVAVKALNFANTNTTDVVNCILGGLNAVPTLVNDVTKNNLTGKTATFAGLTGVLTSEGGSTQVLAITEASTADDYCTAATGITLPTIDQRGYTREGVADAGAFEFGGTLGLGDNIYNSAVRIFPNPASDYFMVSKALINAHYGIYDITGKNVKQGIITSERIDIDLKSGLYLFKAETNLSTITKKIIVK